MRNVLVIMPSYHRKDLVIDAWKSMKANLLDRFEGRIDFRIFTFIQDATPEEQAELQSIQNSIGDIRIQDMYVPKMVGCTIGHIKREAIIHGLRNNVNNFRPDVILLCDDDVIVKNEQPEFVDRFERVIEHMVANEVAVANARVARGRKAFTIREFPSHTRKVDYIPYLERFMLLSGKPEHLRVLLGDDICQCTVGEDGFLFVKGLCGGFKTYRYSGLYDFIHLQHEAKKPGFVYRGGFEDLVKESDPNGGRNWKSHTTKYKVAARNGSNSQKLLDDFYHGEVEGDDGRRVRPDILDYISRNIRIDEVGNIVRLNGKEIYHSTEDEDTDAILDPEFSEPVEIGMQ